VAATYDISLPTAKDHIRLALGDTNMSSVLLADETIEAKLAAFSYTEALAQLAEGLATLYAQKADKKRFGDVSEEWSKRIDAWTDLASRARAGLVTAPDSTVVSARMPAAQQLTQQAQTIRTARADSATPTAMEGFRPD